MKKLTESEAEEDLVQQLRRLTGAGPEEKALTFGRDGITLRATYHPGSSSHVEFEASYPSTPRRTSNHQDYRGMPERPRSVPRPMSIKLARETVADRVAKQRGVAREVQTGDAAFDAEVYVDTPSADDVVLHVLAAPALRAGVRTLIDEGLIRLVLDDERQRVTATLSTFASPTHDGRRGARIVDALAAIVAHASPVVASGERPRGDPAEGLLGCAGGLAFLLFIGAIPAYFAAAPSRCVERADEGESLRCEEPGCCTGPPIGCAAGLPLAIVLAALVRRRFRGRSSSHTSRTLATVVVTTLVVELAVAVATYVVWHR